MSYGNTHFDSKKDVNVEYLPPVLPHGETDHTTAVEGCCEELWSMACSSIDNILCKSMTASMLSFNGPSLEVLQERAWFTGHSLMLILYMVTVP